MIFGFRLYTLVLVSLAVLIATFTAHAASPSNVHLIDSHGRRIPSIFHRTYPNRRFALELLRMKGSPGSCSIRDAVYHPSDRTARVVRVDGCSGHYMEQEERPCSYCGGSEGWTYSDGFAPYCQGYTLSRTGCDTGNCNEEYTCFTDFC
jgi:hypothetical protein